MSTGRAPADGTGGARPGRRSILGGLAALPVLYGAASAVPALAASPVSVPAAAGTLACELIRGQERRYNAPLLAPGTRLLLPAGVKAVPVLDYYHRPRSAPAASAWPYASGRTDRVMWDASRLPVLWVYGEFGATPESPYRDRFYSLALQPMSRNPHPVL